jgi:hypothetical protein
MKTLIAISCSAPRALVRVVAGKDERYYSPNHRQHPPRKGKLQSAVEPLASFLISIAKRTLRTATKDIAKARVSLLCSATTAMDGFHVEAQTDVTPPDAMIDHKDNTSLGIKEQRFRIMKQKRTVHVLDSSI